ncbi:HIRAN domain-containing protein [Desulfobacter sp. UBA2225]|uniref:HIRAN domain-containing protein n=1 Tax=Desulfobacter sp. UBA2225 TaxID=1961413 RepID=UPI00257C6FB4|nr:HIRAN domain-containing protein [Desulfobacter sp. UBA2225]
MEKTIKLAGVTYGPCQENIKNYACPMELGIDEYDLVREPENPADPNAVRVEIFGFKFGYIPKEQAQEISPLLKSGHHFSAKFVSLNRSPFYDTVGLTVKITEKIQ